MNRVSRRAYVGTVLAGPTATGAGCLDDVLDGDGDGFPDLLVLADGRTDGKNLHAGRVVTSFAYDADRGEYRLADRHRSAGGIVKSFDRTAIGYVLTKSLGGGVRPTADRSTLAVLNSEATVHSRTVDGVPTVTVHGGHVYTASQHGFAVYDTSLGTVGSVPLPEEFSGKHMEDVIVHDGVAYVVDDVFRPLFLFRVDVTDPSDPEYLEVVEVGGTNPSLGQQWIDPDANAWLFLLSTGGRQGSAQHVVFTPKEGAETADSTYGLDAENLDMAVRDGSDVTSEVIHEWDRESDETTGTRIDDVTTRPPVYASVTVDGSHYLSSVEVDYDASPGDDRITFGTEVELPAPARVVGTDRRIVALSNGVGTSRLHGYDPDRDAVVLEQELDVEQPLEVRVPDR